MVLLLVLVLVPISFAQGPNVRINNPDTQPVPVKQTGAFVLTPSGSPMPIKATTPIPVTATTPIPVTATTPIPITATTPIPITAVTPVPVYDAGSNFTDLNGVAGAPFTSADQTAAVASVTDAPTSGQKLVISDLIISVDTAMRVDFTVESSATVIESIYMAANSTVNVITRAKRKLAPANKKLQVKTSAAGNIRVNAFYHSEL
jgi:hypothetical protein